jgi:arabinogalactan oligomer / maltooligosaccharide transport system permease protein
VTDAGGQASGTGAPGSGPEGREGLTSRPAVVGAAEESQVLGRGPGRSARPPSHAFHAGSTTSGVVVKFLLLAAVNGLGIVALYTMAPIQPRPWGGIAAVVAATLAINAVYLSRRRLPLKYLLPGTLFLLAFQIYPVLYTGFIAFTNYGTGNILTKPQAVLRIEAGSVFTPPDAVRYGAVPVADGDDPGLLLTAPDGTLLLGTTDGVEPVDPADEAVQTDGDQVVAVGGYERLSLREAQDRQREFQDLRIPLDDGEIRLTTFREAVRRDQRLVYDDETDTMTDQVEGVVYSPDATGYFRAADGARLTPGWRVTVGWQNFTRVFTSPQIRGPFLRVFVWTYVFAVLSVVTTFALGLGLAMTLNHPGMRFRRLYRSLLIAPYALPSFMTALVWAGMLNREFGVVNQIIGAAIPWLTDPTMAKVSILLVNLWLGFPYMFLITTGALQAIPGDLREAASVDGASAWSAFRRVTFPLLLISVAPLLIASFAFNFNNFNLIFLLTRGGPPIIGAQTPAGHTDILISYTYRLAFAGGRGQDFGFAAAIAVVIFIMVAAFSAYSFRYTRSLEEIQ